MPGLLNRKQDRGGLLSTPTTIRQISTPFGTPGPAQFANMGAPGGGGQPEYGSDDWAYKYGGPGALFFRQLYRGFVDDPKNPLAPLAPGNASKYFDDRTIGLLGDKWQTAYGKKGK